MSKCAAIQMASSPNISANLLEAEKLIAEAVKSGAKLVALPENFALMGNNELDKVHAKESDGLGIIQNFLETTAKNTVYGLLVARFQSPVLMNIKFVLPV
jgi:nitrilase